MNSAILSQITKMGLLAALFLITQAPKWELINKREVQNATIYQLIMDSGVWVDTQWKHNLEIIVPKPQVNSDHIMLFVTGDRSQNEVDQREALDLLPLVKLPIAILYDVPNQPLFENLREDALIARSFRLFLDSGDKNLPALVPMVRAVRHAMTVLSEFSPPQKDSYKFVLSGASKRGWTTYLAATQDNRIVGIIPEAFNMLNIRQQLKTMSEQFQGLSEAISDYTAEGLHNDIDEPRGLELLSIVDPYEYRNRLLQPILCIVGTNDRFWNLNALDFFWEQLPARKSVYFVPNTGHSVPLNADITTLRAAFIRSVIDNTSLPSLTAVWKDNTKSIRVELNSEEGIFATLWVAESDSMDFRDSEFKIVDRNQITNKKSTLSTLRTQKNQAAIAIVSFKFHGKEYYLSSIPRIFKNE